MSKCRLLVIIIVGVRHVTSNLNSSPSCQSNKRWRLRLKSASDFSWDNQMWSQDSRCASGYKTLAPWVSSKWAKFSVNWKPMAKFLL